ncbi:MAG: VWA domain-containing protein, partial [Melioribacteraceae bacterium]|nr:VWA domain-containing protein [Melioribacteraceae bacterium]
ASCSLDKNVVTPPTTNTKIPHSPSPANGASDRENFQRLSWESSDASSYTVYFDKINPPATIAKTNSSEKYADVVAHGKGITYYWKVDAKYSDGSKGEGPVWHFTTSQTANTQPGYILETHSVTTEEPNIVKMLFQVTDIENKGIDNLTISDFNILEDGEEVSIFESNLNITKRQNNPYLMKTVLMLDNSTSISDDANNLQLLKDAAKNFVDNMAVQQEVALYKFSNEAEMVLDFTSDKGALKNAIDNINRGFATTNLYGAVIDGVSQWDDKIEPDDIVQGSLVLFTDGNDTQGSHTLQEALNAIGDKKVYTVGLGSEIEPEILKQIGNQGAYLISEMSELNQIFLQIQQEIDAYANSFYWMEYLSPKRGNNDHTIYLTVKDNPIFSVAEGSFSSAGFYDPSPGIYLNSSFVNQQGDSSFILVAGGDPVEIKAVSYGGDKTPVYSWGSNSSLTVTELNPPTNSHVKISANSNAPAGKSTLNVDDTENGYSKTIEFNISR